MLCSVCYVPACSRYSTAVRLRQAPTSSSQQIPCGRQKYWNLAVNDDLVGPILHQSTSFEHSDNPTTVHRQMRLEAALLCPLRPRRILRESLLAC